MDTNNKNLTPETLEILATRHYTEGMSGEVLQHAKAWKARERRLKLEVLGWRTEHYGDMLALGKLDPAEFDKRIASLNTERVALDGG